MRLDCATNDAPNLVLLLIMLRIAVSPVRSVSNEVKGESIGEVLRITR